MSTRSGSFFGRRFYQQMPESRRNSGFPVRMWRALKRVAAKSVGFYAGKRRILVGLVRKVVWASVYLKRRVVRAAKGRRERQVMRSYDHSSYLQNFDDGRWREEEEEFYRSRSFAQRFGHSTRSAL
ncbi:hypothetical protein H6P81_001166 [Aristolochia fimbriata]|uniref:Uncharacterized protein n=1 Tax=Aristolochia fimbriata TaxID=158543 RepID=A0AAV7F6P8_ARIFI|nr:hypothetical protein H6P81_001166 [Aristolochia fimbriata]